MRIYIGVRTNKGCKVAWTNGPVFESLNPRYDLRRHSPAGFEWGYGGSGPAQLALALCCHVLGNDDLAQMIYQAFKFRVIGRLDREEWNMDERELREVMDRLILEHRLEHGDERACTQ